MPRELRGTARSRDHLSRQITWRSGK